VQVGCLQHLFSTYQYFWVLGASTYSLDHNPTRIHMNLNMDKNNVRQLDQNDERRQDNDQPSHEDESDEEYLTPSASDKSHHDHANSAHANNK
jgi:hypothetical protein